MMRINNNTPYPLRVLVLPVDAHGNEAVAHYAAAMARNLARERDQVYLAITPGGWCAPFEDDEPMQFVAWLAPPPVEPGVPGSRRDQRAHAEAVEATRCLVRAVQPECVLFVAAYAGHGLPLLEGVAAAGVPTAVVVLDAHDPHAAADARPVFLRRQAYAHQWVATTAQAQRVLARRLDCPPGAFEVCFAGVPVKPPAGAAELERLRAQARAALHLPADAVMILSQGPMDEDSGCLDWAEAAAMVGEFAPDAAFVWAGHGPLSTSMEEILRHAPHASRVRLVRESEAPERLALAADIAVFPSRAAGSVLAVGRAMAAGIPVIATAVDPLTEMVRPMREGLICAKANPASLAGAIRHALENPVVMRAMAQTAYLRVQDFSEERAVGMLRPLLERLSVLRGAVRSPGQYR